VKGSDEIGVRGSICASDFIVGAGAPGGVRLPCPKRVERCWLRVESRSARATNLIRVFIVVSLLVCSFCILPFSFCLPVKTGAAESPDIPTAAERVCPGHRRFFPG